MVESLQTIIASRPPTRPMPVISPAPWMSSSYMPCAASGPSSRKGEPGSTRRSTRSRGRSLPRARCRSRARFGPPFATAARRRASSLLSASQAARFACAASDRRSTAVSMTGIPPPSVKLSLRVLSRAAGPGNAGSSRDPRSAGSQDVGRNKAGLTAIGPRRHEAAEVRMPMPADEPGRNAPQGGSALSAASKLPGLSGAERKAVEEQSRPNAALIHETIRAEGESELERTAHALLFSGVALPLLHNRDLHRLWRVLRLWGLVLA